MSGLAAGVFLVAAVVFGALLWRARLVLRGCEQRQTALERQRIADAAVLAAIPLAWFRWPSDPAAGGGGDSPNSPAAFAEFVAGLDSESAARVETAVIELRQSGIAFAVDAHTRAGVQHEVCGQRTAGGDCVVWLADVSAVRGVEAARDAAVTAADDLREIIDALPNPVWRRDFDGVLVDCNSAYATALDAPRATVLDEGRALAPTASGRRHVVIGGSRRLLDLAARPARDGGTIGFATDLTDVETAEIELSRHINAHGEVLESIAAAVAIYGADKRLKFFNTGFAALWGIEPEWLRAEPSLDEILQRLRESRRIPEFADFRAFRRQQAQMFTSLIEPTHELMHLPDDRTVSLSISPHPLGGLIFVYEDVTDRLALESSFHTLSEVQRETLDHLFEGIAVYGSDGRLKLHNPAYRKIWGLDAGDVAGEPHVSEIVEKTRRFYDDGSDWPAMKERIIARVTAHALAGGPLDRRDGSMVRLATLPLPDGNVLQTCLDVTDTARVERALRERNEALETAGRLKSEFIANVSYELRTPLNAIIGFAEILTNQYFGTLAPRQLDYSRGILDSSHRLLALINDILDLATIEAGYLALETAPVDIGEMMQGVLTLTRERARNQDLSLSLDCPPDIGTIDGDERRLKQALFNLISNAIKFTPAGGAIRIDAARDADMLVLRVADTGVGIPAADQARVFGTFERGSPQARHSGAGLGLSLVKSLIELHGGRVVIESAPGQGTIVECRLPAQEPIAAARSLSAN